MKRWSAISLALLFAGAMLVSTVQGASATKGSEHTSNKSPSNKEKHERGQAAKKKQEETGKFLKAKKKASKSSKYQQKTGGSHNR